MEMVICYHCDHFILKELVAYIKHDLVHCFSYLDYCKCIAFPKLFQIHPLVYMYVGYWI